MKSPKHDMQTIDKLMVPVLVGKQNSYTVNDIIWVLENVSPNKVPASIYTPSNKSGCTVTISPRMAAFSSSRLRERCLNTLASR